MQKTNLKLHKGYASYRAAAEVHLCVPSILVIYCSTGIVMIVVLSSDLKLVEFIQCV